MKSFKNSLVAVILMAAFSGFSQVNINQNITAENDKIKIHVEKEENGKKTIFDKTYDTKGLNADEQQELINRVTDSLSAGSGKNGRMKVKVDRSASERSQANNNGKKMTKKIIIKKNDGNSSNSDDIDIEIDDLDNDDANIDSFKFNMKDFNMDEFHDELGGMLKEFGPMMKKFGSEMEPMVKKFGNEMEPYFKKFNNGDIVISDIITGSKTIKNLNAYPNKPNNNKLNVKFTAPEKGTVTIRVTDLAGKEIGSEKLADFSGEYIGQVDLKGSTKGTVFVAVVQGDDGAVKRIVLN